MKSLGPLPVGPFATSSSSWPPKPFTFIFPHTSAASEACLLYSSTRLLMPSLFHLTIWCVWCVWNSFFMWSSPQNPIDVLYPNSLPLMLFCFLVVRRKPGMSQLCCGWMKFKVGSGSPTKTPRKHRGVRIPGLFLFPWRVGWRRAPVSAFSLAERWGVGRGSLPGGGQWVK